MTGESTLHLCTVATRSRQELGEWLRAARRAVEAGHSLPRAHRGEVRLALCTTRAALERRLAAVDAWLNGGSALPDGAHFTEKAPGAEALAFVFPGQGSQYPGMLAPLCAVFSPFRDACAELDALEGDRARLFRRVRADDGHVLGPGQPGASVGGAGQGTCLHGHSRAAPRWT